MSNSPFIEGTKRQFAWDSTSLGWLKTCPRLYEYHMIRGLRSKNESVHLRFGIEYHHALEFYDHQRAQGSDYETALRATVRELLTRTWEETPAPVIYDDEGNAYPQGEPTFGPWESGDPNKNRFTLLRSVIWYLEEFRNDAVQTVILSSGKPAVELSFRFSFDDDIILCGHLDKLAEFQGNTYVVDRKTTKGSLSAHYFDSYSPDNQMSLYSYAAQVMYNVPAAGVIIDAVRIAVGFSEFGRGFVYRSPSQLEEWALDTKIWIRQAWAYADAGYWPMNDKSCDKFGGCAFRSICSRPTTAREQMLRANFIEHHWNPLEIR